MVISNVRPAEENFNPSYGSFLNVDSSIQATSGSGSNVSYNLPPNNFSFNLPQGVNQSNIGSSTQSNVISSTTGNSGGGYTY